MKNDVNKIQCLADSDIEMGPVANRCTCFPSLDECHSHLTFWTKKAMHWLLLTSPGNAVTWPTVAPRSCFTRLSMSASLMNKGPVYWPLLVSFEKRTQLKQVYPEIPIWKRITAFQKANPLWKGNLGQERSLKAS